MAAIGQTITVQYDYRPAWIKESKRKCIFHLFAPGKDGNPVAVVEFSDGTVGRIPVEEIQFADGGCLFREVCFRDKYGNIDRLDVNKD